VADEHGKKHGEAQQAYTDTVRWSGAPKGVPESSSGPELSSTNTATSQRRALFLLRILLLTVFAAAIVAALGQRVLAPYAGGVERILFTAGLLTILLMPALVVLVYRPLERELHSRIRMTNALRNLVTTAADAAGRNVFNVLAARLSRAVELPYVLIVGVDEREQSAARVLAFWRNDHVSRYRGAFALEGDPCGEIVRTRRPLVLPSGALRAFPNAEILRTVEADGYAGVPVLNADNQLVGVLSVFSRTPLSDADLVLTVLKTYAGRVGLEIERRRLLRNMQTTQQQLADIIRNSGDIIFQIDLNGRFVFVNRAAERITGYSPAQLLQMTIDDLLTERSREPVRDRLMRRLRGEDLPQPLEADIRAKDGRIRTIEVTTTVVFGNEDVVTRVQGVARDVTERRRTQGLLQLQRNVLGRLVSGRLDVNALLELLCQESTRLCPGTACWVCVRRPGSMRYALAAAAGVSPEIHPDLERLAGLWDESVRRTNVASDRDPETSTRTSIHEEPPQTSGARAAFAALDAAPFRDEREELLGWVAYGWSRTEPGPADDERRFAKHLTEVGARLAGIALRRARMESVLAEAREREVQAAREIQQRLLLGHPPERLRFAACAGFASPSAGVGGDFMDFYNYSDTCFDVVVGDVMGKGIAAALVAAGLKTLLLRAIRPRPGPDGRLTLPSPATVVQEIDDALSRELTRIENFITLFFMRFDLERKEVVWVDCGHPPPLRWKRDGGTITLLEGDNLPLGFRESQQITEKRLRFDDGDVFLLYSDGISEARNPEGRFFGADGIERVLQETAPRGCADAVLSALIAAVRRFQARSEFHDDVTAVAVVADEALVGALRLAPGEVCASESLRQVRDFVHQCLLRTVPAASEEARHRLILAVQEALTNIGRHACRPDAQAGGAVVCTVRSPQEGELVVDICHPGKPFRDGGTEQEFPDLESGQQGGFGLYIMDRAVDVVEYVDLGGDWAATRLRVHLASTQGGNGGETA